MKAWLSNTAPAPTSSLVSLPAAQSFSKCGPQTSGGSSSVTWKFRDAPSPAPPQTKWIKPPGWAVGPASCSYNSLPGDPDTCSGWEPGLRPVTQRQWLPHWVTVSSALAFRWLSLIEPTLQVCECLWYRHHPNPYHNASKETTFPPHFTDEKTSSGKLNNPAEVPVPTKDVEGPDMETKPVFL